MAKLNKIFVHVSEKKRGWGWELDAAAHGIPDPKLEAFPKSFDDQGAAVHAARAAAGKACKARRRRHLLVQVLVHSAGHSAVDSAFTPESRKPRLTYSPELA